MTGFPIGQRFFKTGASQSNDMSKQEIPEFQIAWEKQRATWNQKREHKSIKVTEPDSFTIMKELKALQTFSAPVGLPKLISVLNDLFETDEDEMVRTNHKKKAQKKEEYVLE